MPRQWMVLEDRAAKALVVSPDFNAVPPNHRLLYAADFDDLAGAAEVFDETDAALPGTDPSAYRRFDALRGTFQAPADP